MIPELPGAVPEIPVSDDLHRAWRSSQAILLSEPESKSWGLHEFTAADPDGNRFRVFCDFATPERERVKSAELSR